MVLSTSVVFCCLFSMAVTAVHAQGIAITDSAIPVGILPSLQYSQFIVVNQDRSILAASTSNPTNFAVLCAAPGGVSGKATSTAPIVFDENARILYQVGAGQGSNVALVGTGLPFSGTTCNSTASLSVFGTSATLSSNDAIHGRLLVLTSGGAGTPDVISSFSTLNAGYYGAVGSIKKIAQSNLAVGGTYSSMVTDVDGLSGFVAITQLRTDTTPGGLWIYLPSSNRAIKILGPGGTALPAVNAFIVHNPMDGGGSLLYLANQDNLTSANLSAPPPVTAPYTIIDLGQLRDLVGADPFANSITLPFVSTISSKLGYYAVFGAAISPLDGKLYELVGGGTNLSDIYRRVVRYDPSSTTSPETVVADLTSLPLNFGSYPQLALNVPSGTLQVLTTAPNAVYTVDVSGVNATATASQVSGSTFGDSNFQPTFISANPLVGETYIASASGNVDILTRPANVKPRGLINMTAPEYLPAPGLDSSVQIGGFFPEGDTNIGTTQITVTATAASTNQSFVFATVPTTQTLNLSTLIKGTLPAVDVYTLVASFPGDATYAAFQSAPVIVAVGMPLFNTQIALVAGGINQTNAVAAVTLTGSTYVPGGTIVIQDPVVTKTLATYTLPLGPLAMPVNIPFPVPAGTTYVTATYSGDSLNSMSHSAVATISFPVVRSTTSLSLTAPVTSLPDTNFTSTIRLTSANGGVPTGLVTLAAGTGTSHATLGTVSAAQAFSSAGATVSGSLSAGVWQLFANYPGDPNFLSSSSNFATMSVTSTTGPGATLTPGSLTFTTLVGSTSALQTLVLRNNGSANLSIANITASGAGFSQFNGCPSSVLVPGDSCQIRVAFAPTVSGTITGAITVVDNAANSPQSVTLIGNGTAQIALQATTGVFVDQTIGTSSINRPLITLTNNGAVDVDVSSLNLNNKSDFELVKSSCPATLGPQALCHVSVVFHPDAPGSKTATVTVNGMSVSFAGKGLAFGTCVDTDGDGLCDDWENNGVWVRMASGPDQFVDLSAMGANFRHKDIFLDIDWMATDPKIRGAHTHQPLSAAMKRIVDAFANAPLMNIDGTTGISLHIDCGAVCYTGPGAIYGASSKSKQLAELAAMDPVANQNLAQSYAIFDQLSTDFKATGRALAFHHVIFAHDLKPKYTSGGNSRNASDSTLADDPKFYSGASDLIVAMGSWQNSVGSESDQTSTLMHELGHNLGLAHGGQDQDNFKPNYLSIMNYSYEIDGLYVDGNSGLMDYSEYALPSMNERNISEIVPIPAYPATYPAIGVWPSIDHMGFRYYCPGSNPMKALGAYTFNLTDSRDWDCDVNNKYYYPSISMDVNFDGKLSLLTSYQDWPNLKFNGGAIAGAGAGAALPATGKIEDMTYDQKSGANPPNGVSITSPSVLPSAPGSTINVHFVVLNRGLQGDTFTLAATSTLGWTNTASLSAATLTLAGGAAAEVSVSYTVPAGAVEGDSDRLLFTVKSSRLPNVRDSAEILTLATTTPNPLSLSAASLNLGVATSGSIPAASSMLLINTGSTALTFPTITTTAEFAQSNTCGSSLAAGASCAINLTFTPAALGVRAGTLSITSSASSAPLLVDLRGNGIAPPLQRPAVTMTVNPATAITGQLVTFTANVTAGSGAAIPTGTVQFLNGGTMLGQGTLDAQGSTSFTSSALGAGTYSVQGAYSGDVTYAAANAPNQVLAIATAASSVVTLSASATTTTPGGSLTFTATVAAGSGTATPTGVVRFFDGAMQLGIGTLSALGTATFSSSTLPLGPHTITAVYGGDSVFSGATSAVLLETVAQIATNATLSASAATTAPGSAVTYTVLVKPATGLGVPTGTVRFLDGTTQLGTDTLNTGGIATFTTSSLSTGAHTITAGYLGDATFAASTSLALTQTVALTSTKAVLAASAGAAIVGSSVTFTATISASSGVPTGNVTFLDGTTSLGSATLNASGVATYATNTLAIGTHSILAQYGGAGIFAASVSTLREIIVTGMPDYGVTANPASLTLAAGSTGVVTFTFTPVNVYVGTISMQCGALPTNAKCSFAPAQLAFTSGTQTPQNTVLTLDTRLRTTALNKVTDARGVRLAFLVGLPFSMLCLLGLRRKAEGMHRLYLTVLLCAFGLLLGAGATSGCAGGAAIAPTTAIGTYTIPITITDGTTNHSISYSVTVN